MADCKTCDEPLTPENTGVSGKRCLECESFLKALASDIQKDPAKYHLPPGQIVTPWDKKPHG